MIILLVDDDEDDQDIFREAVSIVRPDCEVRLAMDGEHGLNKLSEASELPDYIFLDVNMPKMDGKEFLQQVKSNPLYRNVPVIIYSTSNHTSEMGKYFKMGASNFITKPSEFNLLVTYLRAILRP